MAIGYQAYEIYETNLEFYRNNPQLLRSNLAAADAGDLSGTVNQANLGKALWKIAEKTKLPQKLKQFWKNLSFDGPSAGFSKAGEGRIFGIRYKKDAIKFRLDFEPIPGSNNMPRLHINFESKAKGTNLHVPLDPRSAFDYLKTYGK